MTNQLEIRHFEYFLVLAETLHYRKAAEKLYISQSALSQQIQRLEMLVGQELFIRTNRKVMLSEFGVLFKRESELIIQQLHKSMERWQLAVDGVEGVIRIGFVGSAMQVYLPPLLQQFSIDCPKIRFYLEDLSNQDQLAALEKRQLDIGFMRANDVPETMKIKSVYKENFSLVVPKNHRINADTFVNVGQLAEEPFILFPNTRSQMYYQQIIKLCGDYGFSPHISHRSIHGPTIFKLVESGLGVSIVPNSLKDEYNYQVNFIELNDVPYQTELFAVWNKDHRNTALPFFLDLINNPNCRQ